MRDLNFRSVPQNRAAVSITGSLYDRRALDCTSDRPLINSLNHLTYLTSTSNKVRDTLCNDGGLERLVSILKSCVLESSEEDEKDAAGSTSSMSDVSDNSDAESVSSRSSQSSQSSSLSLEKSTSGKFSVCAYKWMLSLQCLLFLGTRGTEKVRKRIVEAGMIPVITTILDNFLFKVKARQCVANAAEGWGSRGHHHHHGHHHGHHHHGHQHRQQLQHTQNQQQQQQYAQNQHLLQQQQQQQQHQLNLQQIQQHLQPQQQQATYQQQHHQRHETQQQMQQAIQLELQQADRLAQRQHPMQFAQQQRQRDRHDLADNSPLNQNRAIVQQIVNQSNDDAYSVVSQSDTVLSSNASIVSSIFSMSSASTAASSVDGVPSTSLAQSILNAATNSGLDTNQHLQSPASGAVYHTMARGNHRNLFDNPMSRHQSVDSFATTATDARSEVHTIAEEESPAPEATGTTLEVVADDDDSTREGPVVTNAPPPRAPVEGRATGTAFGAAAAGAAVTGPAADSSSLSGRVPTIRRSFHDGIIVPQTEDILWALEILAFVTKYAYLKPNLQSSHLVPALSMRDKNQPPLLRRDLAASKELERNFMEVDQESHESVMDYDNYDFLDGAADIDPEFLGDNMNLFRLVEHFTAGDFAKDIKYWAGVIMRNSCRKDDSRGGIRQCANFECGKWEEFPRQFAKCKRCKRTKYCSKECQMTTWGHHKHWCVPSTSGSATSGASSQQASRSG